MKKKVVFLGSKPVGATCFQYLLEMQEILNYEVVAAKTITRSEFDSDDNTVEDLAEAFDIPLIEHLDDMPECDIIYSVQHNEILKKHHIDKATQIAVNLHLAPLPEYRGCNQFSFAIMDNATSFGVTIHQINTNIDHGKWLFQKRFEIDENIWVADLLQLSVNHGVALFKSTLKKIVESDFNLNEYDANITSKLIFRKDIMRIKEIHSTDSSEIIERKIRATSMPGFEPPFIYIAGVKMYITSELD